MKREKRIEFNRRGYTEGEIAGFIVEIANQMFKLDVSARNKTKQYITARRIVAQALAEMTDLSQEEMGLWLGRDRASFQHLINTNDVNEQVLKRLEAQVLLRVDPEPLFDYVDYVSRETAGSHLKVAK